jgi:hypothetical protein
MQAGSSASTIFGVSFGMEHGRVSRPLAQRRAGRLGGELKNPNQTDPAFVSSKPGMVAGDEGMEQQGARSKEKKKGHPDEQCWILPFKRVLMPPVDVERI